MALRRLAGIALVAAFSAAAHDMPQRLTLLPDQPQQVGDLHLRVVEIVEKRLTDGSGEMRVRVQAQRGSEQRLLEFTSAAPQLEWAGQRFRYLGGWRSEVQLEIEPAD